MAYGDFKYLTRRTASDKILCDKAFIVAKNPKYDGYQRDLASIVYKCFDKKTSGRAIKNENISKKELAEELHKPIIRKFEKRKVHSPFIDSIWGADLADMQLRRKSNKGIHFLLYVNDIFIKYAWVIPLKDKKKTLQLLIRKNIFACLFSVHNTISLSRHEQVCLMRLRFERYFSHHRAT